MYKYSAFNRNRKYFLSFHYVKELFSVIPGLTGDLLIGHLFLKTPGRSRG